MCGEQKFIDALPISFPGSSPRVRGADRTRKHAASDFGIIPACAGSSDLAGNLPDERRDHPRVCGEQNVPARGVGAVRGSSPRVRGAESRFDESWPVHGIIPACAGSRTRGREDARGQTDHPRVCGEQSGIFVKVTSEHGSSPRVRGAAVWAYTVSGISGIIPACAGSRCLPRWLLVYHGDHPRVCGEQRSS